MTQPPTPRYSSGASDGSLGRSKLPTSQLPFSALEKHFLSSQSSLDALSASTPIKQNGNINGAKPEDSVGTHLLVSTAIVESANYPILSLEEVEDLKKELQTLSTRIESAKKKLMLESKVRDAAQSLSRLYQKKGTTRRKSILSVSSNPSENGVAGRTDEELNSSERKCEELTRELWTLTNKHSEIQKRLLQHNVGILGSTHSGATSTSQTSRDELGDGLMRSDTQTIPKDTADKLLILSNRMDTLLRTIGNVEGKPVQGLGAKGETVEESLARLESGIYAVEQRSLKNNASDSDNIAKQMWDLVMNSDGDYRNKKEARIPDYDDEEDDSEDDDDFDEGTPYEIRVLFNKVQRICMHRDKLSEDKSRLRRKMVEQRRGFDTELDDLKIQYEGRIDEMNVDLKDMEAQLEQLGLQSSSAERRAQEAEHEVKRIQAQLTQKEVELKQVAEGEISALSAQQQAATRELDELRATLKKRDEDFKAREDEARALRDQLQAVSQQLEITKDQLEAQAEELNEKAQLEEELDKETDAHQTTRIEFAAQLSERDNELSSLRSHVEELQQSLVDVQQQLDESSRIRDKLKTELSAVVAEREEQIKTLQNTVSELEKDKAEQVQKVEAEWEGRVAEYTASEERLKAELSDREAKVAKLESDAVDLQEAVARFSMEAVTLRAELDAAHGSRQQRAAETAEAKAAAEALEKAAKTDPSLLSQIDDLKAQNEKLSIEHAQLSQAREKFIEEIQTLNAQLTTLQTRVDRSPPLPSPPITELNDNETLAQRCALLQTELDGMLAHFEQLTKDTIEYEGERKAYDEQIDKLRDRVDQLESTLADERIKGLGADAPAESRSTIVLKNEFKKMMRDMRAESTKQLRAEQEERRRLESLIRSMKKEAMGSRRQTASSIATTPISLPPTSPPPPKIMSP